MSVSADYIPTPTRHKSSQAVVRLNGRDHYLGRYGTNGAKLAYERIVAEWLAHGRTLPGDAAGMTINELIAAFWPWAKRHYRRPDGTATNEVTDFKMSLRPVRHLYGDTPAKEFGPLALKAVRELFIKGYDHPKHGPQPALARGVVNQRVARVRRMFKWAVENELVPPDVFHGLQAVRGLQRGRCDAKESKPVLPVARAVVDDTLPLLRPMIADMVRLQLETGMRPGEMVIMRGIDLDTTGNVWLYRPGHHKTEHHGHGRTVPIGPKAQGIIRRCLTTDLQAFLFSPVKCMEERKITLRLARKSKVQPSQFDRSKAKPKRKPGERYTTLSYGRTIAEAIKRHNKGKPEAEQIPHWHPHQLRHTRALELKREFGLDVARAVLGHKSPVIAEHYATLDIAAGVAAMARVG